MTVKSKNVEKSNQKPNSKKTDGMMSGFDKLWQYKYIVALVLLQALSAFTTFYGMHSISGSLFVASVGMLAVQILFAGSWHELLKPEEKDGKRKSYVALSILGVACLFISGFFSSIGFYQETKLEGARVTDARNHNVNEHKKAKEVFTLVVQQGQKNLDSEISAIDKLIEAKSEDLKNSTLKAAKIELRKEVKNLAAKIKELEAVKAELAEMTLPDSVNSFNPVNTHEVVNIIENLIKTETQKIAVKGKFELTPQLLNDLSYKPLPETNAESNFFEKLLAGDASILIVCVIGFGIDFGSILALFANVRGDRYEDIIYRTRGWVFSMLRAIFSLKTEKPKAIQVEGELRKTENTSAISKEIDVDVLTSTGEKIPFTISVKELSESGIRGEFPQILEALRKDGMIVDQIHLPQNWMDSYQANNIVEIKALDYSRNGKSVEVAR